ncbi:MAG: two component transcriptional regulator, LuxR family [Acidobacteria bacterium]|jgi:DNA-binding NarL/FixJ family response regulator|nr:two component transcriptional regulator, LuxR family [Acidobacteriota bacterium]
MARPATEIRIVIADENTLLREGLRSMLEEQPGFRVVGEAAEVQKVAQLAEELMPDILLLDMKTSHLPAIEALQSIVKKHKKTRVILLAGAIERGQASEAFRLGARGVMRKDSDPGLLFKCIRAVMAGQFWVMREAISDLAHIVDAESLPEEGTSRPKNFSLTPREMEILAAVVSGLTNREIAGRFSISEQTVKHHVTNIFDKLGVYNRLELALFAVHHGLIAKPK